MCTVYKVCKLYFYLLVARGGQSVSLAYNQEIDFSTGVKASMH